MRQIKPLELAFECTVKQGYTKNLGFLKVFSFLRFFGLLGFFGIKTEHESKRETSHT